MCDKIQTKKTKCFCNYESMMSAMYHLSYTLMENENWRNKQKTNTLCWCFLLFFSFNHFSILTLASIFLSLTFPNWILGLSSSSFGIDDGFEHSNIDLFCFCLLQLCSEFMNFFFLHFSSKMMMSSGEKEEKEKHCCCLLSVSKYKNADDE